MTRCPECGKKVHGASFLDALSNFNRARIAMLEHYRNECQKFKRVPE